MNKIISKLDHYPAVVTVHLPTGSICDIVFRCIHSSDFRNAISEIGLSSASKTVQNVLVHCKLDSDGFIDFSQLERFTCCFQIYFWINFNCDIKSELARERSLFNTAAQAKPIYTTIPTSAASTITPWRTDVIHKKKVSSELQSKRFDSLLSTHSIELMLIVLAFSSIEMQSTKSIRSFHTT